MRLMLALMLCPILKTGVQLPYADRCLGCRARIAHCLIDRQLAVQAYPSKNPYSFTGFPGWCGPRFRLLLWQGRRGAVTNAYSIKPRAFAYAIRSR